MSFNKVSKTEWAILALMLAMLLGGAYLNLSLAKEKASTTTDCAPPVNEWDKLVARLQKNDDGVLVLICMHEEILHWGVK